MVLRDQVRNYAKKLVEDRPALPALKAMIRDRKPRAIMFADDGIVPNNRKFPLLVYRNVFALPKASDPAMIIDTVFEINGWGRSWRDTVYDFVHYHSRIHEVMGVARGSAKIEFGGVKGRILSMKTGDVAILPAGTGHRLIDSSRDFLVVGAYPEQGAYDECTDGRDRPEAIKRIAKTGRPATDPIYGRSGPLPHMWKGIHAADG